MFFYIIFVYAVLVFNKY